MHTDSGSLCSRISAKEQVRQYKEAGYDGIVVTDHFVNGNSAVDRRLSWHEQMDMQFRGYREAAEAGAKCGLRVYEGTEFAYCGTEFIILGLGCQWFKEHPEIAYTTPERFLPVFRAVGAAVIHAHPYREASYISEVRLFPELVDAVEGYNLHNLPEWNEKAMLYAAENSLPVTSGSDCHDYGTLGAGIRLDREPDDAIDLAEIIKSGRGWECIYEIC